MSHVISSVWLYGCFCFWFSEVVNPCHSMIWSYIAKNFEKTVEGKKSIENVEPVYL